MLQLNPCRVHQAGLNTTEDVIISVKTPGLLKMPDNSVYQEEVN